MDRWIDGSIGPSQGKRIGVAEADCEWDGTPPTAQPTTARPTSPPTMSSYPTVTPVPSSPSPAPSPVPTTPEPSPHPTPLYDEESGTNVNADDEGGGEGGGSAASANTVGIAVSVLFLSCVAMACLMGIYNAARRHKDRLKQRALARQRGEMPSSGLGDDVRFFLSTCFLRRWCFCFWCVLPA